MSWFVGQEVGVLRETGVFKVLAIEKAHLLLEDEFGFQLRVLKAEVVQRLQVKVSSVANKDKAEAKQKAVQQVSNKSKDKSLPFIDLHAEELGLPVHFTAHDVFTAQINEFKGFCNRQLKKRSAKFLVIHGAGEGRLKQEIRVLCAGKSGIVVHDAQWSNGAVGTSLVELTLHQFEGF